MAHTQAGSQIKSKVLSKGPGDQKKKKKKVSCQQIRPLRGKHDSSLCLAGKPDLPSTSGWKMCGLKPYPLQSVSVKSA